MDSNESETPLLPPLPPLTEAEAAANEKHNSRAGRRHRRSAVVELTLWVIVGLLTVGIIFRDLPG